MIGLLGRAAIGAAEGAAGAYDKNVAEENRQIVASNLLKESAAIEESYRLAKEARVKAGRVAAAASVEKGAAGLLARDVEAQAGTVSGILGASDFVRNEKGASPEQVLAAKRDAALAAGETELSAEYGKQAGDIRAERRLDQADVREDHRFKIMTKQADAALRAAERTSNKALDAAHLNALSEGVKAVNDRLMRLEIQLKDPAIDPALKESLTTEIADLKRLGNQYNTALAKEAKLPAEKPRRGVDDLFPRKGTGASGTY